MREYGSQGGRDEQEGEDVIVGTTWRKGREDDLAEWGLAKRGWREGVRGVDEFRNLTQR